MRKNYITLHRFCSYKEYEQYMSGSSLHNHTDHYHGGKGGSLSRGFCFFMGDVDGEIDMPNPFHVTYLLPPAFERLVESLREIAIASARAKAIMERISAPQGLLITLDEMPKNEAWRQLERECRPTCDLCCHYQAHPPRCQLSKRSISPKQYSCKKYSPKHNHRK